MGIGAGLLAVAGKAGEGAFKGMEKGLLLKEEAAQDDRKSKALALREKSLAAMNSKYRKEENIQKSDLTGEREKEARAWEGEENIEERKVQREQIEVKKKLFDQNMSVEEKERTSKAIKDASDMVDNGDIAGANARLRNDNVRIKDESGELREVEYNKMGELVFVEDVSPTSGEDPDTTITSAQDYDSLFGRLTSGSNKSDTPTAKPKGLLNFGKPVDEMGDQSTSLNPRMR